MDSAASRMRGMPNREATVARLERVRQYCAEHGILPERSAAPARDSAQANRQTGRKTSGQRGGQGGASRHRPRGQQARRSERGER